MSGTVEMNVIEDGPLPNAGETRISDENREVSKKEVKLKILDALLIAFAEHNGFYTAAYKNLFDWTSRIDKKVYQFKPAVLLATSPGPGGASRVLRVAKESAPIFGMDVQADLSVPRFYENFDMEDNLVSNSEIREQLKLALAKLY